MKIRHYVGVVVGFAVVVGCGIVYQDIDYNLIHRLPGATVGGQISAAAGMFAGFILATVSVALGHKHER